MLPKWIALIGIFLLVGAGIYFLGEQHERQKAIGCLFGILALACFVAAIVLGLLGITSL